ncbi:MAG: hypothetical protein ACRDAX_04250 [Propionibacteriaceae bacterium]
MSLSNVAITRVAPRPDLYRRAAVILRLGTVDTTLQTTGWVEAAIGQALPYGAQISVGFTHTIVQMREASAEQVRRDLDDFFRKLVNLRYSDMNLAKSRIWQRAPQQLNKATTQLLGLQISLLSQETASYDLEWGAEIVARVQPYLVNEAVSIVTDLELPEEWSTGLSSQENPIVRQLVSLAGNKSGWVKSRRAEAAVLVPKGAASQLFTVLLDKKLKEQLSLGSSADYEQIDDEQALIQITTDKQGQPAVAALDKIYNVMHSFLQDCDLAEISEVTKKYQGRSSDAYATAVSDVVRGNAEVSWESISPEALRQVAQGVVVSSVFAGPLAPEKAVPLGFPELNVVGLSWQHRSTSWPADQRRIGIKDGLVWLGISDWSPLADRGRAWGMRLDQIVDACSVTGGGLQLRDVFGRSIMIDPRQWHGGSEIIAEILAMVPASVVRSSQTLVMPESLRRSQLVTNWAKATYIELESSEEPWANIKTRAKEWFLAIVAGGILPAYLVAWSIHYITARTVTTWNIPLWPTFWMVLAIVMLIRVSLAHSHGVFDWHKKLKEQAAESLAEVQKLPSQVSRK